MGEELYTISGGLMHYTTTLFSPSILSQKELNYVFL
jgi:hypothetical protein